MRLLVFICRDIPSEDGMPIGEVYVNAKTGAVEQLSNNGRDVLPAIMVLTEIAAQCSRAAQMLIDESFPEKKK